MLIKMLFADYVEYKQESDPDLAVPDKLIILLVISNQAHPVSCRFYVTNKYCFFISLLPGTLFDFNVSFDFVNLNFGILFFLINCFNYFNFE